MKTKNKIIIGILMASMILPIAALAEDNSICTQEAKMCPDGSSVGRTGPNCQFALCPGESRLNASTTRDLRGKTKEEIEKLRQEASSSKDQIRKEAEQKRQEVKDEVKDKIKNVQSQIKERFSKFMDNVVERLNTAVDRLNKIADRIDSRIAKIEKNGGNVTEAKTMMVDARAKIEIVKTDVSGLQTKLATTTADNLKIVFPDIKSSVEKSKSDIRVAQAALLKIVANLMKIKVSATTTVETSN